MLFASSALLVLGQLTCDGIKLAYQSAPLQGGEVGCCAHPNGVVDASTCVADKAEVDHLNTVLYKDSSAIVYEDAGNGDGSTLNYIFANVLQNVYMHGLMGGAPPSWKGAMLVPLDMQNPWTKEMTDMLPPDAVHENSGFYTELVMGNTPDFYPLFYASFWGAIALKDFNMVRSGIRGGKLYEHPLSVGFGMLLTASANSNPRFDALKTMIHAPDYTSSYPSSAVLSELTSILSEMPHCKTVPHFLGPVDPTSPYANNYKFMFDLGISFVGHEGDIKAHAADPNSTSCFVYIDSPTAYSTSTDFVFSTVEAQPWVKYATPKGLQTYPALGVMLDAFTLPYDTILSFKHAVKGYPEPDPPLPLSVRRENTRTAGDEWISANPDTFRTFVEAGWICPVLGFKEEYAPCHALQQTPSEFVVALLTNPFLSRTLNKGGGGYHFPIVSDGKATVNHPNEHHHFLSMMWAVEATLSSYSSVVAADVKLHKRFSQTDTAYELDVSGLPSGSYLVCSYCNSHYTYCTPHTV